MKQITNKILKKYINKEATVEEQALVEKTLITSGETPSVKEMVEKKWEEYETNEGQDRINLNSVLERVHHIIKVKDERVKIPLRRKLYKFYSRAAAILLIPLIIGSLITFFKLEMTNTLLAEKETIASIHSPVGTRMEFSLPDGSRGFLNGGSTIKYPIPFTTNRQITLDGEAYFDVKKDRRNAFEVTANSLKVRVLGTRFNVNSYRGEKFAEVVLEEGVVECIVKDHEQSIILNPNESVKVLSTGITKSNVNVTDYIEWKDGKLSFRGSSMEEVQHKLESWYNIDIEISDKELYNYSFKATFNNDTLEEVLQLLKMTSPIRYKVFKREKRADGTYSKTKVVLYKQS